MILDLVSTWARSTFVAPAVPLNPNALWVRAPLASVKNASPCLKSSFKERRNNHVPKMSFELADERSRKNEHVNNRINIRDQTRLWMPRDELAARSTTFFLMVKCVYDSLRKVCALRALFCGSEIYHHASIQKPNAESSRPCRRE